MSNCYFCQERLDQVILEVFPTCDSMIQWFKRTLG